MTVISSSSFRKPEESIWACFPELEARKRSFVAYHPGFWQLFGPSPKLSVLLKSPDGSPLYHEAGACFLDRSTSDIHIFITSNLIETCRPIRVSSENPLELSVTTLLSKVIVSADNDTPTRTELLPSPAFATPNGACAFGDNLLLCDQGLGDLQPSQLVLTRTAPPLEATPLLNNYHGRPFNSLNDVIVLKNCRALHQQPSNHPLLGSRKEGDLYETIWFTDPSYGTEQGFKPAPQLPPQVYCFDPWSGSVRAVADGFIKPNGICFDPQGNTCYITDTAAIHGSGTIYGNLPGSIYAFDVDFQHDDPFIGGPLLQNRRLFAFVDSGAPDGIKVDSQGNVFAGCFDGIHIWNKFGTLLGKILFTLDGEKPRGCANFCFISAGRLIGMAEDRLYLVEGLVSGLAKL